ncbi:MAG: hypothetical protein RLP44_17080 [Aggregatilineales bacterium]
MTTKHIYRKRQLQDHWLNSFLPTSQLSKRHNPVFNYDVRRLELPEDLPRQSVRWIINATVLPFAVWGLFIFLALMFSGYVSAVIDLVGHLVIVFIALSLFNTLSLDFMATISALRSIDNERIQGRWALLRISGLRMTRIVQAKHTVAQLNVWHSLCVVIGFRLAIVLMIPAHMLILHLAFPQSQLFAPIHLPLPEVGDPMALAMVAMPVYLIVAGVWLIEPLWRVRALTAASLVTAGSQVENGLRPLVMARVMLRFNLECTGLFCAMIAFLYVGIMGANALALTASALLPLLMVRRYQNLTQVWLKKAETRLSALES